MGVLTAGGEGARFIIGSVKPRSSGRGYQRLGSHVTGESSEKHFSLPERQKYFLASSPLAIVPTLLL